VSDPQGVGASRPAPQYGQYATPEEQRARIRQPDASIALDAGVSPATLAQPAPTAVPAPAAVAPRRRVDRIITVALLAYGLIAVIMTAFSLADFPAVASSSMKMIGIPGEFTNFAQGRLFGAIAAVALVVGWLITAFFSVRRLRKGRLTWWVPLVGAVVTYAIVYALLVPAIIGDPAFMDYVRSTAS
jgi:energy-converting hydrogenase Eha subunit C